LVAQAASLAWFPAAVAADGPGPVQPGRAADSVRRRTMVALKPAEVSLQGAQSGLSHQYADDEPGRTILDVDSRPGRATYP